MFSRDIGYLFAILKSIVDDVSDWHCIVDIRLVLDAQQNICRFIVLFDDCRFQHITVFLNRFLRLLSIFIW